MRAIQSPLIRPLQNAALLIRTRRWKYRIGLAHVAPTAAILAATALIYLKRELEKNIVVYYRKGVLI